MAAGKVDYARMAFDRIEDFDQLTSVSEVMGRLSGVLNGFGYTSFLITGVPEPPIRLEPCVLLNGWSAEWASHYAASGYKDDPVAAYCRRSISPFDCSDAPYCVEQNPRAAEVMNIPASRCCARPAARTGHLWTRMFVIKERREGRNMGLTAGKDICGVLEHSLAQGITALTAIIEMWWLPRFHEMGWTIKSLGLPELISGERSVAVKFPIDAKV